MTTKIHVPCPESLTLYVLIRLRSNGYIYDVGDEELEAVGTWDDARIGECDIPVTDNEGGHYTVDFPAALPAGKYDVQARQQVGASPAITDPIVAISDPDEFDWDGTALVSDSARVAAARLANKSTYTVDEETGVGTEVVRNAGDTADLYTITFTEAAGVQTRSAAT